MSAEPSLALQTAVRARLIATPAVTALVPASHILDDLALDRMPAIVLGEAQVLDEEFDFRRVHLSVHLWADGSHIGTVKHIAGAVENALETPLDVDGFRCFETRVAGGRFMRDPSGQHVHAVLDVTAMLQRVR